MRINPQLLAPVVAWAKSRRHAFRPNGRGRQFGILQDLKAPPEAWEIKRQIVESFGLRDAAQEPVYKDFCGYITDGRAIQPHQDCDHNGKQHVRYNILVSKPIAGGMPVQGGVELEVGEGDVWRCDASRVQHWCTPVVGVKPRIVLSFGFLI